MADQVKMWLIKGKQQLDSIPAVKAVLQPIEDKTNVPKEYFVLGVAGILLLLLLFSNAAGLLCNLLGFGFGAFHSLKAIESDPKRGQEDYKQWLVYWVIYAFFTIIETFVSYILYWIPFYFAFKLAFLVFLAQYKGAVSIYDSFLKGLLQKYERAPDASIDSAKGALDAGKNIATNVSNATRKEE